MSHRLIIKDAVWQLLGRILSALAGLLIVKMISPYLGVQRFGDYKTILDYFAIRGALADFGLYVIALKTLGAIKEKSNDHQELQDYYGRFVFSRFVTIGLVYIVAILIAYLIPAYTSNPFLIYGLPLGMMFSASFMVAGILQLPLQLFWKMEQVSFALVGARLVQIAFLALLMYVLVPVSTFGDSVPLNVFLAVVFSVFLSGVFQGLFVWKKSQRYLRLRVKVDWSYTRGLIKKHWQYGSAYFLSSFHTLFVAILFSIYYPTIEGYGYVGMRSLALVFITILIIIPATLGNSMIHKIADASESQKRSVLGNFLTLMLWVGGLILIGSVGFADQIIYFVGGTEYLGTSFSDPGSNVLLPWLALILIGSFIKQTFNYNFVAYDKQHLLLWVNLLGVIIGVPVSLFLVSQYGLIGGLWAQGLLEILFVAGAVFFSFKHHILPQLPVAKLLFIVLGSSFFVYAATFLDFLAYDNFWMTGVVGVLFFCVMFAVFFKTIKSVAKGLSPDS